MSRLLPKKTHTHKNQMSLFMFHASKMSGKFDSMATGKISIVKKEAEIDQERKRVEAKKKKMRKLSLATKLAF